MFFYLNVLIYFVIKFNVHNLNTYALYIFRKLLNLSMKCSSKYNIKINKFQLH